MLELLAREKNVLDTNIVTYVRDGALELPKTQLNYYTIDYIN